MVKHQTQVLNITENMDTLSTFHQRPICMTKNQSFWDQRSHPFYSTLKSNIIPLSQTSWKLYAQAKGFGGGEGSPNSSMQKKENAPKKGSGQEQEDEDDDKIPSVVFDRIMRRVLASVGLPLALGVVMLKMFSILKENQLWDAPRWVTFITTFVLFGSSVLGVAYGSLSTSWDAEKKGSVLGFEEAKQNWDEMWKEDESKTD